MADTKVTLVDIQTNYKEVIEQIADYKDAIEGIKQQQKALKKEYDDGNKTLNEYSKEMAVLEAQMKNQKNAMGVLTKQLGNQIKQQEAEKGSLIQLRAQLSNLTAQYDALSASERRNAEGTALRDKISKLSKYIKEAEFNTERYYRNVGNYAGSIEQMLEKAKDKYEELVKTQGKHAAATKDAEREMHKYATMLSLATLEGSSLANSFVVMIAGGNKFIAEVLAHVKDIRNFKDAMFELKIAINNVGKAIWAFLTNPVGATVAAIAGAFYALSKGISSSEENTNKFNLILAPFKGILESIISVIQKVTGVVLDLGVGLVNLAEKFGLVSKASAEQIELARINAKVLKEERDQIIKSAETENKVAKLRASVADKQKYTAEERRKMLQEAINLEEKEAIKNQEIAEMKLKALQLATNASDNDAETNRKLAEAQAEVTKSETEYYNKTLKFRAQLSAFDKEADEERKQSIEKYKTVINIQIQEIRKAEDAMMALLKDTFEKREKQLRLQYDREIDDLKRRLKEEHDLTEKARDAINNQIIYKQQQLNIELNKINQEQIQQQIDARMKLIQSNIEVSIKGSEQELNERKRLAEIQLEQQLFLLKQQYEEEKLTREQYEQLVINEHIKHADTLASLDEEQRVKRLEATKQTLANELAELKLNEETKQSEILAKELETSEKMLLALQERGQLENQTQAQYDAELLAAKQQVADKKKAINDYEIKNEQIKKKSMQQITGALIGLVDEIGESNEAMAKLSKVLALANIAINTGEAISSGIKEASKVPFPASLEAIATMITTILTNMGTAISTVKSAKFATGGYVQGAGTGTSDSIPARLSNGEFVINAASTKAFRPLLEAINNIGSGVPMQVSTSYDSIQAGDIIADSFKQAVQEIKPVVSVVEITEAQNRVETIQRLEAI